MNSDDTDQKRAYTQYIHLEAKGFFNKHGDGEVILKTKGIKANSELRI